MWMTGRCRRCGSLVVRGVVGRIRRVIRVSWLNLKSFDLGSGGLG